MSTWLVWQLCDSAFPVGGFAHSAGLEAALAAGELAGEAAVARWIAAAIWQAAGSGLPLVAAAWRDPDRLGALDRLCDERLFGGASHRASRLQGRALVDAAARIFGTPAALELRARIAAGELAGHFAPAHGAVLRGLGVELGEARRLWMWGALRGSASAAVRLGALGAAAAQRVQRDLAGELDRAIQVHGELDPAEAAWLSPVQEIFAAAHDRLDRRLFTS